MFHEPVSLEPQRSGTPTVQSLRQRLTSACVILLVAAVSLDHRPIPHPVDTTVALAGTALALGLAVRAAPRTRVLYLAGALFGVAVALSSLPIREQLPILGMSRAFYLPALVLVAVAAVLAWPELRAALSQDREKVRTAAVENNRAHVSRELHDETLQALIHLRRSLEHATAGSDPAVLQHAAKEGAALAAEQITALRDIIADLHPPLLTELGLSAALETLVDRTARQHPELAVTYQQDHASVSAAELASIDVATALTAYRITQEALSNAIKHSGATRIAVRFSQHGNHLTLRISDNGVGLENPGVGTERTGDNGGLGIPAIHARAALHHGEVTIQSNTPAAAEPGPGSGAGTSVTAHLRGAPIHRRSR